MAGRILRQNADYFFHDADASNDEKILYLESKFGLTGYAVYFKLLEKMTRANNFELDWNEIKIEIYASEFGIQVDQLNSIVAECCRPEIKAFIIRHKKLFSGGLKKRMLPLMEKRKYNRKKYNRKKGNVTPKKRKMNIDSSQNDGNVTPKKCKNGNGDTENQSKTSEIEKNKTVTPKMSDNSSKMNVYSSQKHEICPENQPEKKHPENGPKINICNETNNLQEKNSEKTPKKPQNLQKNQKIFIKKPVFGAEKPISVTEIDQNQQFLSQKYQNESHFCDRNRQKSTISVTEITQRRVEESRGEKRKEEKRTSIAQKSAFYLTAKKKKLTGKRLETFERFWKAFNYKKSKAPAADAWLNIPELTNSLVEKIIQAAAQANKDRQKILAAGLTPIYAQGWITQRRWEDEEHEEHEETDEEYAKRKGLA
jgi:hypothetical protein